MSPEPAPDEHLLSKLPLPLAQLYRRAHNAKAPLEKHLTAFYLWEAVLRLTAAAVVAEHMSRVDPDTTVHLEPGRLARPELGVWWDVAREVLPDLARRIAGYQQLREALFGRPRDDLPQAAHLAELLAEEERGRRTLRTDVRLADLFDRLIVYRYREIGHGAGAQRADAYHQRMGPVFLEAFGEVFRDFDPLAGRVLFYLDSVHRRQDDRVIEGDLLVGETPKAKVFPADMKRQGPVPIQSQVYLLDEQSPTLKLLAPWVWLDRESDEVFFFNRVLSENRLESLCFTSGRQIRREPSGTETPVVLRLLGLTVAPLDGLTSPAADSAAPETILPGDTRSTPVPVEDTTLPPGTHAASIGVGSMFGEFEVLRLLGRGGMATVYLAWQQSLGRRVAVKVYDRYGYGEREWSKREIQALAGVDHPSLVKVFSSGEIEGRPYYAMEFIEGRSLREIANPPAEGPRGGDRTSRAFLFQAVHWMRQVAEALSVLHTAGVVHGDPKPSNILVTGDGSRAVLIDPIVPPSDHEVGVFGTPAYMSPERIEGRGQPDPRSDIYTVGLVLWELLTGQQVQPAGNSYEVMLAVSQRVFSSVRAHNRAVPSDLDAVVLKCLEHDADRRYATADDLAADLGRWLRGEPVRARSPSVFRRLTILVRQNPWPAGASLILTLIAGVFTMAVARIQELERQVRFLKALLARQSQGNPNPDGSLTAPAATDRMGWYVAGIMLIAVLAQWVVLFRRRTSGPSAPAGTWTETIIPAMASAESPPSAGPSPLPEPESVPEPDPASAPGAPAPAQQSTGQERLRTRPPGDDAFSSQMVVLRYPAPIAIAYRRFCARSQPRDRLAQLFDTFEITLKYLVYLGLSDLCRARVQDGPPYTPLSKHQGFDLVKRPTRMTLGRWVRSVIDIADELATRPDRFIRELPQVCGSDSYLNREFFRWIKDNRDAVTHCKGGISLHSEKCPPLISSARPRLERLLQEVAFLRRYPLGFVTAGYPTTGNRSRYRVHSCMGARVASGDEVYPMEAEVKIPAGVPFVVAPDETAALCLWPFLLQRESDATQRPTLYVFEEIDADRNYLTSIHAAAIDHEDNWLQELQPVDQQDHNWLWEALRLLPQTVPLNPALRLAEGLAESLVGRLTRESLGEHKQYKLVGPIARGGFGTVYDAIDVRTRERVAVKVLEDHEGLEARDDLAQLERFKREYEKLRSAGLDHPGIVRCFEWGIDILGRREYPWFSMEFASGGDLNERLRERQANLHTKTAWDSAEMRAILIEEFRAITEAVAHLHDLNIIHRDIKPANILVLEGGELRLSDFGLVKETGRPRTGASAGPGSSRGAVLGTRDYMAPEQEQGDPVTKASDVYSLGIVLAELATGYRPQASQGVTAGSPIERDVHLDHLPEPLRRLILHWTDVDPSQRPEDARLALHQFDQVAKKMTK
jgi:serine/threonine protein kinase